jgi:proline racemase
VNTTITGRGWIHGKSEIGWQASDPFPHGFFLTDTWGEATDLMLTPRGPGIA